MTAQSPTSLFRDPLPGPIDFAIRLLRVQGGAVWCPSHNEYLNKAQHMFTFIASAL